MPEQISKAPHARCWECPLVKSGIARTTGPEDAKIAFVSRSPGYYDEIAGVPFAGPSGKVLDHLLEMYGVKREEILTTNVVLCKTDDPPNEAVAACKPRLEAEIGSCDTVIAGGVEAVSALTRARSVTGARGREHHRTTATGLSQRVVATTNPAVVLRESGNFPDMVRDFRLALDPVPPVPWKELPQVYVYDDPKELFPFLDHLLGYKGMVACDLEVFRTTGKIACGGFALEKDLAHVIDYEVWHHPEVQEFLHMVFKSPLITWLWHNGKYDVRVLRKQGIEARVDHDTFLLSYALDERPGGSYTGDQGAGLHALTPLLMEDHGWPDYEYESVKEFKKETAILSNPNELYHYNGLDTAGTWWLWDDLVPKAVEDNVYDRPYLHTHIPLANALISIEMRGFGYNVEAAADLNENYVLPKLNELTEEMQRISGLGLLNPRSPAQCKVFMYDTCGLKHDLKDTRKIKKTGSVDADVRREIKEGRFTCKSGKREQLIAFTTAYEVFQKIDKQRGTYIEGLIKRVQEDGRLYPTFKFGTVSGRTSSENPNFQNITRSGANGIPSMRTLFVPSEGCRIVQADYSQAELRTIAKLSGDKDLLGIYRDSTRSLHKERALAFYGEGYDKEQYTHAKNMNFGITYGQTAYTFSQQYEIPEEEAQAYVDSWWEAFPGILKWVGTIHKEAKSAGVIVSPFGHKRRFHLITRENKGEVFNQAVSFLPQSIAGVLTEHAVIRLVHNGVPVVNTVHDSIVADVPESEVVSVAALMKTVMEDIVVELLGWQKDDIPFLVDISVGDTWGTVEEIEMEVAA